MNYEPKHVCKVCAEQVAKHGTRLSLLTDRTFYTPRRAAA